MKVLGPRPAGLYRAPQGRSYRGRTPHMAQSVGGQGRVVEGVVEGVAVVDELVVVGGRWRAGGGPTRRHRGTKVPYGARRVRPGRGPGVYAEGFQTRRRRGCPTEAGDRSGHAREEPVGHRPCGARKSLLRDGRPARCRRGSPGW